MTPNSADLVSPVAVPPAAVEFSVFDAAIPADLAAWRDHWNGWPDREIMAHPDFVRRFAREGDQVLAAAARTPRGGILYPFILRPLASEPWAAERRGWDATTPYGYGGPFGWNPAFVWEAKTLLIGTDPVAIDRVELEIVEQKRREVGAPSLFDRNPANLGRSSDIERTAQKNPFYREPNHIRTASELGLGTWDLAKIDRRKIEIKGDSHVSKGEEKGTVPFSRDSAEKGTVPFSSPFETSPFISIFRRSIFARSHVPRPSSDAVLM